MPSNTVPLDCCITNWCVMMLVVVTFVVVLVVSTVVVLFRVMVTFWRVHVAWSWSPGQVMSGVCITSVAWPAGSQAGAMQINDQTLRRHAVMYVSMCLHAAHARHMIAHCSPTPLSISAMHALARPLPTSYPPFWSVVMDVE